MGSRRVAFLVAPKCGTGLAPTRPSTDSAQHVWPAWCRSISKLISFPETTLKSNSYFTDLKIDFFKKPNKRHHCLHCKYAHFLSSW